MPIDLKDHRMDWDRIERRLIGVIERDDPMYRAVISAIRRNKTMSGQLGATGRLRQYLLWLRDRAIDPRAATQDDVEEWLAGFGPERPAPAECHLAHVRMMYRAAVKRGLVATDPTDDVSVGHYTQRRVPALDLDQTRALLSGVREELADPRSRLVAARDLAILTVLVTIGPRASELRAIAWADLQLEGDQPWVMLRGKGRSNRTVRLPQIAVSALRIWRQALIDEGIGAGPDDAITIGLAKQNQPGLRDPLARPLQPMSNAGLRGMVGRRLDGILVIGPRRGPHRLRATAATLAHLAGASIVDIGGMLGHARLDTTREHYIVPADALASTPPTACTSSISMSRPTRWRRDGPRRGARSPHARR